jgi:uracil-DNA glycosylase
MADSKSEIAADARSLKELDAGIARCRGCRLWERATQAVCGEGSAKASVMLVGEQPGDQEDLTGKPFVGPAGKVLDEALEKSGVDRKDVYVTNAVKHFKWAKDARTKRRIHKTPNAGEIRACFPWLQHEIALIKPRVIVCLGATAAKALLGRTFSVMKSRGMPIESELAPAIFATVHPSAVLRAPPDQRVRAEKTFMADVRAVGRYLAKNSGSGKQTGRAARKFSAWSTIAHPSATSNASIRSSRE